MKKHKYPVLLSLGLMVLFPAVSLLASLLLTVWDGVWSMGEYLPQLIAELILLAVMVLLSFLLGMRGVYRPGGQGLQKCLVPSLPILLLYTFALLETVILCAGTLRPPLEVLWFVLCMLAVGLAEELTFRGLMTRMIYEKYGGTTVGVWLSVLVSSLLFGAVHVVNALGGTAELGSVLVQMVGAAALGMCLAAIYLRTKSLWTVALLHGYMDLCALASSGIFADSSLSEMLSGYSASNLVSAVLYAALALFLLRPSQMKCLTDPEAAPSQNEVAGLMAAVMLLSGLSAMVTVLTV